MEEYEYLEDLSSEELIGIISEMLDFEETAKALIIFEERDAKRALELGKDIIKNNKGDDYLQATVWNVLFFDNEEDMIEAVNEREEDICKTLLDEIIIDLTDYAAVTSEIFLNKIKRTYMALDNKDRCYMRCKYEEFLKIYP